MVAMALALSLGGAMVSSPSEAGQKAAQVAPHSTGLPVHYDGHRGRPHYQTYRGGRHHVGVRRRAHDQARIAEAARREARRIEQERAARRAWHHRQPYGRYLGW
jgi:hypothetical protein